MLAVELRGFMDDFRFGSLRAGDSYFIVYVFKEPLAIGER